MNSNSALRMLLWKDTRQLLPLLVSLVLLSVVLLALIVMLPTPSLSRFSGAGALLLALPSMFAIGAGAMMVGQEKELRTMQWLISMPIRPQSVLCSKLIVATVALALLWCISWLCLIPLQRAPFGNEFLGNPFGWVVHSVFLLFVGFALAWFFRSAFHSLLMLIPIACLPLVISMACANVITFNDADMFWLNTLITSVAAVAFAVFGWRAGLQSLRPVRAIPTVPLSARGVVIAPNGVTSEALQSVSRPTTPHAALMWQAFSQSRLAFIGLAVMLVIAAAGAIDFGQILESQEPRYLNGGFMFIAIVVGWLSICWLGVLVFQGDELGMRKRFLADRGVSPARVWLTRQMLPLAIVCTFSLAFAGILNNLGPVFGLRTPPTFVYLLVLGIPLAGFCFSQWLGQLIPSPIVAYIAAPLAVAGVLILLGFYVVELESPMWLLFIPIALSLLVTFLGTQRWLDHRRTTGFWCIQALCVAVAFTVPAIPFVVHVVQLPSISNQSLQELKKLSDGTSAAVLQERPMGFASKDASDPDATGVRIPRRELLQNLQENDQVVNTLYDIAALAADLRLARLRSKSVDAPAKGTLAEEYRTTAEILLLELQRLRSSGLIRHQDTADRLELFWMEELKSSGSTELLSESIQERLLSQLRDKAGRRAARKAAVAASFENSFSNIQNGDFGGYSIQPITGRVTLLQTISVRSSAGVICEMLLKQLNASTIAEIADYQNTIRAQMKRNPTDTRELTNQVDWSTLGQNYQVPGELWNLGWENEAAEL